MKCARGFWLGSFGSFRVRWGDKTANSKLPTESASTFIDGHSSQEWDDQGRHPHSSSYESTLPSNLEAPKTKRKNRTNREKVGTITNCQALRACRFRFASSVGAYLAGLRRFAKRLEALMWWLSTIVADLRRTYATLFACFWQKALS